MTDSYNVGYSVDALGDLREIYSYIANELLVPEAAAAQPIQMFTRIVLIMIVSIVCHLH